MLETYQAHGLGNDVTDGCQNIARLHALSHHWLVATDRTHGN
jgi:hypothetical protein